jgi:hypothetical protein
MNYVYNNQLDALFIRTSFIELSFLYTFRASTAHHQEVRCVYVANGTCMNMAVSGLAAAASVPLHPDTLTVILEVPYATYTHLTS